MSDLPPPRFEVGPAMLLAGPRRRHAFAEAEATLAEQWRAFAALGTLPGQRGDVAYGVMCGTDPASGTFEYLSGVEVDSFDGLEPGIGRMRVPAQRYAVFTHRGGAGGLRAAWDAIWHGWLPASGRRPANTPDFERYDPRRFDARTGEGEVEIWFPVAEPWQEEWAHGAPRPARRGDADEHASRA